MKLSKFIVVAVFFMVAHSVMAQEPVEKFFIGKWETVMKGLPMGDIKCCVEFKLSEDVLSGSISGEGQDTQEFNQVKVEGETIIASYVVTGYTVVLELDKTGDNEFSGTLTDQFDVEGKRMK